MIRYNNFLTKIIEEIVEKNMNYISYYKLKKKAGVE